MNVITGVSPPSCPANGTVFYDQNLGTQYVWDGTIWCTIVPEPEISKGFLVIEYEKMVQYMDELGDI